MKDNKSLAASCCKSVGVMGSRLRWSVIMILLLVGFAMDALVYSYAHAMPWSLAVVGAVLTAAALYRYVRYYTSTASIRLLIGSQLAVLLCMLSPLVITHPVYLSAAALVTAWYMINVCTMRSVFFWSAVGRGRLAYVSMLLQPLVLACMPYSGVHALWHCGLVFVFSGCNRLLCAPSERCYEVRFDISAAWAMALFSSWVYSLSLILLDISRCQGSSWYYLSDCWKTLAVVLFNKKMQAGWANKDMALQDVDNSINQWLDKVLPWMAAYAVASSLVCGYGLAMGGWVACRLIALSAIMACPCVLSCVGPFVAMANRQERNDQGCCPKQRNRYIGEQVRSSLSIVRAYYIASMCLAGGVSLCFFGQLMQPWHGALMMLTAQAVLYVHIMFKPAVSVAKLCYAGLCSAKLAKGRNCKQNDIFCVSKNSVKMSDKHSCGYLGFC